MARRTNMKHRKHETTCTANRADSPHVMTGLDVLCHYHTHHTDDKITRFRRDDGHGAPVDVYIVSDPEWLEKMRTYVESQFPPKQHTVESVQ